jgi:hypothetical protein
MLPTTGAEWVSAAELSLAVGGLVFLVAALFYLIYGGHQ